MIVRSNYLASLVSGVGHGSGVRYLITEKDIIR